METKTAVTFPAFVTEFIGSETSELMLQGIDIIHYLNKAADVCGEGILDFNIGENSFLDDELKTQFVTYIFSCAVSDLLKNKGLAGNYIAGYSMGIYAALYHAGSICFTDGLRIINQAFRYISENAEGGDFAMGLTGGLTMEDVVPLMKEHAPKTFIINCNNVHTFIYSGPKTEIIAVLEAAKQEGALMTRLMNVTIPYHTSYLSVAATNFSTFLTDFEILQPEIPLISSLTRNELKSASEIRLELSRNLHQPFNWHDTIRFFLNQDVKLIFECGAGEGLTKINKFIDGDYKTINLKNFRKFLHG